MMDWAKLLDLAEKLAQPGLVDRGIQIAKDMAEFVALVRANVARAEHVLSAGDRAELDAIHADTLATTDAAIARLDAASKR